MSEEIVKKEKSKLEEAFKLTNKRYGEGSVIGGGQVNKVLEVVDTGSLTLNIATDCGGFPLGKLIEIQGPNSVGKSTLTLHAIASYQKTFPDRRVLLVDYEYSLDYTYATALGVDMEKLVVAQPECAEDGYNMIETFIKTGEISLVVVDSHTAGLPKAVVDGEVGQVTIGLAARVNSVGVGKIKPLLKPYRCTAIFISQQRTQLGGYVATQDSTGGKAFPFYSDMRMKMSRKVDAEAKKNEANETTVEVFKNKCGVAYKKATFTIIWGKGIDRVGEVIDLAVHYGLIEKGGAWYTVGAERLNGMAKVREFLIDNEEFYKELEANVLKQINGTD